MVAISDQMCHQAFGRGQRDALHCTTSQSSTPNLDMVINKAETGLARSRRSRTGHLAWSSTRAELPNRVHIRLCILGSGKVARMASDGNINQAVFKKPSRKGNVRKRERHEDDESAPATASTR